MAILKVEKLEAGMVLSQNAKDRNGRILVAAGQKITEKHLTILKAWGVTDVVVESAVKNYNADDRVGNFDPAVIEKAEREMKGVFRYVDLRHAAALELFNLCVARKLRAQERDKGK